MASLCSCVPPKALFELGLIIFYKKYYISGNTMSMTRMSKRLRSDRLHCTFSAIMDMFAMEYSRDPTAQEINDMVFILGNKGAIWKL